MGFFLTGYYHPLLLCKLWMLQWFDFYHQQLLTHTIPLKDETNSMGYDLFQMKSQTVKFSNDSSLQIVYLYTAAHPLGY